MSFVRGVWDIFSGILDSGVRVVQMGFVSCKVCVDEGRMSLWQFLSERVWRFREVVFPSYGNGIICHEATRNWELRFRAACV